MVKLERERVLGKTTGDVLKAIYALQIQMGDETANVVPSEIALRTGTSRAFVTKMVQAMSRQGLVEYSPYHGVRLTADGRSSAIELSRHHRLLERFLTDMLGFSPQGAHVEAERLEHVISEEFEARLDAYLHHPTTCPHGAPIPQLEDILTTALSPLATELALTPSKAVRR